MNIPLDTIRENGHNVRRVAASAQADAALLDSVRAQGVLVPILLRPEDSGYVVIAGHRRLRAAREAGLGEIPALVLNGLVNGHATAAQAAENMVRAPMHPVDQWRAIVQLQDEGFTLPQAAASLGMTERFARRLDRLGHLHPDVLALIEQHGLPSESELRAIALAPHAAQAKALKSTGCVGKDYDGETVVTWWRLSQALAGQRISRARAIFDVEKVKIAWDEDLFAEPGSAEQFTTAEVSRFLKAQGDALAAQVKERLAAKERVRLADYSERAYGSSHVALPAGWSLEKRLDADDRPRTKTTESVFVCVAPDGQIKAVLAVDTKAEREREKAADKARKEKAKATAAKNGDAAPAAEEGDDADDNEDADLAPATAPKSAITKEGLKQIAAAKTTALRETLRSDEIAQASAVDMLRLLILALGCHNVQVSSDEVTYRNRHFGDLAARLLLPGGQIDPHTMPILPAIAGEAIARIVCITPAGAMHANGDPAEWIGAAIRADEALPRFDTPDFLAHVNGDELKRAGAAADVKLPAKVSAIRETLAGNLPNWKPAAFGAPAPEPVAMEDDEE
jgi:ParB/RepB/Spo0J family partition protein